MRSVTEPTEGQIQSPIAGAAAPGGLVDCWAGADAPGGGDSDEHLVAELRRGSAGSAAALYDRIEPAIHLALRRVLGGRDREHEDLVQQALVRVVGSLFSRPYQGRYNLRAWAATIATRLAIDVLRRRRHERNLVSQATDSDGEPVEAATSDPQRRALNRELAGQLRWALGEISPEKAEAVLLFDVLGHNLVELAQLTRVSVSAAQSRLVRGRKELRRLMEKQQGGVDP